MNFQWKITNILYYGIKLSKHNKKVLYKLSMCAKVNCMTDRNAACRQSTTVVAFIFNLHFSGQAGKQASTCRFFIVTTLREYYFLPLMNFSGSDSLLCFHYWLSAPLLYLKQPIQSTQITGRNFDAPLRRICFAGSLSSSYPIPFVILQPHQSISNKLFIIIYTSSYIIQ